MVLESSKDIIPKTQKCIRKKKLKSSPIGKEWNGEKGSTPLSYLQGGYHPSLLYVYTFYIQIGSLFLSHSLSLSIHMQKGKASILPLQL